MVYGEAVRYDRLSEIDTLSFKPMRKTGGEERVVQEMRSENLSSRPNRVDISTKGGATEDLDKEPFRKSSGCPRVMDADPQDGN